MIPSEPIGSIPRPPELLAIGDRDSPEFAEAVDRAVRQTVEAQEKLGASVVTDGDQGKPSSLTYPVEGAKGLAPGGVVIPFADGHTRQLPVLTAGPFRYRTHAVSYLEIARRYAAVPVKQAVVAPSALSLRYPADGVDGYSRAAFLDDLADAAEADVRRCLDAGAHVVQWDFTEGRLVLQLDPTGGVLDDFVALNNRVLERFTPEERARVGVHTDAGADQGSAHSPDVDYADLLPRLFRLTVGASYLRLAGEADPERVLSVVSSQLPAQARIFVGVTDPLDPRVETPEEVRDRVLRAAEHLPPDRLGTCDDSGFAPFADDRSTSRDTAFAKIRARLEGTALASEALGL